MSTLYSRLKEVAVIEATQLHLFLSIVILILLLRFFSSSPALFDEALFSCISMPATYTLAYYHARAYVAGSFVVRKHPEPMRLWSYEVAALLSSFAMAYLVFAALSGSTDLITFGAAFSTVQIIRLLVLIVTSHLRDMGVDVQHPIVVVLTSLSVATVGLVGLALFFTLLA